MLRHPTLSFLFPDLIEENYSSSSSVAPCKSYPTADFSTSALDQLSRCLSRDVDICQSTPQKFYSLNTFLSIGLLSISIRYLLILYLNFKIFHSNLCPFLAFTLSFPFLCSDRLEELRITPFSLDEFTLSDEYSLTHVLLASTPILVPKHSLHLLFVLRPKAVFIP